MASQDDLAALMREILSKNWVRPKGVKLPSQVRPVNQTEDFATYLLSKSLNGPAAVDLDLANKENQEPGVLGKTFDWMTSLGNMTQNVFMDSAEQGFTWDAVGDAGKHVAAGVGNFLNPLLEATVSLPGIETPWEEPLGNWLRENNTLRDGRPMMGSRVLGDLGVENKFAKYGGGFAIDVLSDPLSYIGIGLANPNKWKRGAQAVKSATETVTEKAAIPLEKTVFQRSMETLAKPKLPPVAEGVARQVSNVPSTFQPPGIKRINYAPGTKPFVNPLIDPVKRVERASKEILSNPDDAIAMIKARRSDNARRAANVRHGRPADWHDIPDMTPRDKADFVDVMRDARMAKAGKVYDGKGNISAGAIERVVEDIRKGTIPRYAEKVTKPATGELRKVAIKSANKLVANMDDVKSGVKRRADLNPANQANLYNRMFNEAGKLMEVKFKGKVKSPEAQAWRLAETRRMLRAAEDHLIRSGRPPVYWNGMAIRLSDVLDELGIKSTKDLPTQVMRAFTTKNPSFVTDPKVKAAIEKLLARRTLSASELVEDLSKYAAQAKAGILAKYNEPVANKLLDDLSENAQKFVKDAGLTEKEATFVQDLVRNIVNVDKMPMEEMLTKLGPELIRAQKEGRASADVINKVNKQIAKQLGETPENMAKNVSGRGVVDGIMTRVSTWYGVPKSLKELSMDVGLYGETSAYHRAKWLRLKAKQFSRDDQLKAWTIIRSPSLADGETPEIVKFAAQMEDYFKHMLGDSRFMDVKDISGTTVFKSQMVMKDINKHLQAVGSKFQFVNGKRVPSQFDGTVHNFSENWFESWKLADPRGQGQDPVSFMHDMDMAIQRTLTEYAVYDDFAMRFGRKVSDADFDPLVHTKKVTGTRIGEDLYFEKQIRDEFLRLIHFNDEGLWKPNSAPMRFYSKALRAWKTGVTIYYPSHHVRNGVGDTFLMWMAGHNNPDVFFKAQRVLHSQRARYKNALKADSLDPMAEIISKDAMSWAMTKNDDVIMRVKNHRLTAEQIYVSAHDRGLLLSANSFEDIFGEAPLGITNARLREKLGEGVSRRLEAPFGGKAHHVAAGVAEYREHYIRLSHYMSAIRKNVKKNGGDLNKAMDDAAHEVRKWHPDGRDLTRFEQKARYVIPFYSWTRKAVPLVIQGAVQRPSKVLAYPRGMHALQGMLGIDVENNTLGDPFPDDQLFPDWIRMMGIGPIGDPESDNAISAFWGNLGRNINNIEGDPSGYTIVNPSNPFQDLTYQMLGMGTPHDIMTGISDQFTPAFNIPADLIRNKTFSGAPISKDEGGQGYLTYLLNQIPLLSGANRVTEFGAKKRDGVEAGSTQAIINMLTALGLRGTGPYEKSAEYELKDKLKRLREANAPGN